MNKIEDLSQIYPNLPIEIILFFSKIDTIEGKLKEKKVYEFSEYYSKKYRLDKLIQPLIISKVCDILVSHKKLSIIRKEGLDNLSSSYIGFIHDPTLESNMDLQRNLNHSLSCLLYGFPYIYNEYKKFVLPVEYTDQNNDKSLGTCFLFNGGIITAKHCIEGSKKIAIKGIEKEMLSTANFYIHKKPLMDILYINLKEPIDDSILFSENVEILDEIMTLGYPKIAGYHNFLAAENANVSARFTVTSGQIAALAEDIWIKERLFLITAKIKGGNSGGPIINKNGSVVGVSVNISSGDGDYDDLGYGTVIPIKYVIEEIVNTSEKFILDVSNTKFVDFE
jgi:hypothetical protein